MISQIVNYCHNVSGVSVGHPAGAGVSVRCMGARRLRHALPTKKKKNLISKELHEKSVYSIMIIQENKTEAHEF